VSVSLHEGIRMFHCCRRHKFAIKVLCAGLSNLLLLTLTCSSTKHTERIVAFPLQQWLRVRATVLLYTKHSLCECHPLVIHKEQKEGTDCQTQLNLISVICCTKAETRSQQKTDINCSCN